MSTFQTEIRKGAHLEFIQEHTTRFHEKIPVTGFFRGRLPCYYYGVMLTLPTVFFLIAASVLATIHVLSLELYLYWQHLWLDIPVHMLGGATVALGVFTIHDLTKKFPSRLLYPIPVLLFVLMAALAWEVFEIKAGVPIEANFAVDTMIDLIMDMLGGTIGYVVAYSISDFDLEHDYGLYD